MHLVRVWRTLRVFFIACATMYISAARANYRKLPLGRLFLMALPGCMPSLEQPGQPGAEIRVLRHQRHSTGISVIGRLTHP